MEILRFENITKRYGNNTVLDNVSFSVNAGEVFSLLGPSGCGKTTLLRICGGFEVPDSGRVFLDGVDVTGTPANKLAVRTVFQNYALFPHMTVWENVAFGLKAAGVPAGEIAKEVPKYLELVELSGFENRKPAQLSGGQRQRVAIARALVTKPKVLLLDEPLAALDLKLRQRMLMELDKLHDDVGITFIFVTHDQQEAMSISDHIAVLQKGGTLEQIGNPVELYEAPRNSFVAAFIGDTNFFSGVITSVEGDYCSFAPQGHFPPLTLYNDKNAAVGQTHHISIRPEKFGISLEKPPPLNSHSNILEGLVEEVIYLGAQSRYRVRVVERSLSVVKQHFSYALDEKKIKRGDRVYLSFEADNAYMLDSYKKEDEKLLILPQF